MKLVILQCSYLPWLGYFDQMNRCDIFVVYDDIQYTRNDWRNRNRIKTAQGIQWVTVPVLLKGKEFPLIKDVQINNATNWRKDHYRTIKQNYSRARYFKDYIDMFEEVYSKDWKYLIDVDMAFIYLFKDALGIKSEIRFASDLKIKGNRIQKLIDICKYFNASEFLEGQAGKNYIDDSEFERNGIKIEYQNYEHPTYSQLYGNFVSYLSIVDLLFNEGKQSLSILSNKIKECL